MERELFVYVDMAGQAVLAGRLWTRARQRAESATFLYDAGWLEHPDRFSLEPALPLGAAPFHTEPGRALFGSLGDSAPDHWGRALMRRQWRRERASGGTATAWLPEADFLLRVSDTARLGALRFAESEGGVFRTPDDVAPRVLATAIHPDDAAASLELALEVAPYFGLDAASARATVADVARETARWRRTAESYGLPGAETSRMAGAFEHADLELGWRLAGDVQGPARRGGGKAGK